MPDPAQGGEDSSYRVALQLPVGADIEETAGRIIRTGTEGITVREVLDGVDVRVVRCESLDTLLLADIPELGEGVTGAGNELVVVEGVDGQAHDIAKMVGKLVDFRAGFQIPKNTGHVTRGGKDAAVADESTATKVARVARKLTRDAGGTFPRRQVVNRADVVETTAGDEIAARRVGAGHHP